MIADMTIKQAKKLREEARKCFRAADRTADDKVTAALLAYASELEQRARLTENSKVPNRRSRREPAQAPPK